MRSEMGRALLEGFRLQSEEGFTAVQLSSLDENLVRFCAGLQAELPDEPDPEGSASVRNAVTRDRYEREMTELRGELPGAEPERVLLIQRRIAEIGRLLLRMGRR